jgi:hypothetical protein
VWVCPLCFALRFDLGAHLVHLERFPQCLAETMNPERVAAVCRCTSGLRCSCSYRQVIMVARAERST